VFFCFCVCVCVCVCVCAFVLLWSFSLLLEFIRLSLGLAHPYQVIMDLCSLSWHHVAKLATCSYW
jgi:hypothetical protein